jgi:hypothetical protein
LGELVNLRAIEKNQEKEKIPEKDTFAIGDMFIYDGDEYILAQCDFSKVALIHLLSGNRFSDKPYRVTDVERITATEMNDGITNNKLHSFKRTKGDK